MGDFPSCGCCGGNGLILKDSGPTRGGASPKSAQGKYSENPGGEMISFDHLSGFICAQQAGEWFRVRETFTGVPVAADE